MISDLKRHISKPEKDLNHQDTETLRHKIESAERFWS
jgi:hypothetical protein